MAVLEKVVADLPAMLCAQILLDDLVIPDFKDHW